MLVVFFWCVSDCTLPGWQLICLDLELQIVHVLRLPLCATGVDSKELQGITDCVQSYWASFGASVHEFEFLIICFGALGFEGGDPANPHGHGRKACMVQEGLPREPGVSGLSTSM
jgi:hypothetical protein